MQGEFKMSRMGELTYFLRFENQASRRRHFHNSNEILLRASQEVRYERFKEYLNTNGFKCAY